MKRKPEVRDINVNKIVVDEEESNDHVVIAKTLSEAADATEELESRCDEIRKMMERGNIEK
ncbi:MAG: hypothetical protein ACOCTN_03725 [Candidatus Natronoplasma sp.]